MSQDFPMGIRDNPPGKDLPLVSILINNYNYGSYLKQAIDSALNQTYPHIEVIVVDDGSQDNSAQIIHGYTQQPVISIFKENEGQASTFNAAFLASSGEIICFLDADDFFYPGKTSMVVDNFLDRPDIGWIFHNPIYVDAHSAILPREKPAGSICRTEVVDFRETFEQGSRFTLALPATCGLCVHRRVLQQILPMPKSQGVTISDNYLKYAALALSPGMLLDEQLAAQRIHGRNIYTFRNDYKLRAEINIKTGFYLRQNFPQIFRFADKIFARGCGEMIAEAGWSSLTVLPEFQTYLQNYASPSTLAQSASKALLHALWFKLKKLRAF